MAVSLGQKRIETKCCTMEENINLRIKDSCKMLQS